MSENKMADVAKLLGVEFDKEFIVKYPTGNPLDTLRCIITNIDIWVSTTDERWCINNYVLRDLIIGKCTIHKLPWKAKLNEEYYIPMPSNPGRYQLMTNNGSKQDDKWYNDGLLCKTKDQAIEIAKAMIKVAREMQGFEDNKED